jgi:hypothetical protein
MITVHICEQCTPLLQHESLTVGQIKARLCAQCRARLELAAGRRRYSTTTPSMIRDILDGKKR